MSWPSGRRWAVADASFQMTLGRAGFMRLLPAAVGPFREGPDGMVLEHRDEGRLWRIRLAPLPPLRLGPVPMERLQVDLTFEGYPPAEAAAFIDRFLRCYQRGGG